MLPGKFLLQPISALSLKMAADVPIEIGVVIWKVLLSHVPDVAQDALAIFISVPY